MPVDLHLADVSAFQPDIDWDAYKAGGRPGVVIKATEGLTYVSDTFAAQRGGAHRVGLALVPIYHFGHQGNDPAAEAAHFLSTVGTLGPGEVAVLDAENTPDGVAGPDGAWCRAWLGAVTNATGRVPWLYCSWSYWESRLGSMSGYPLWIAAYHTPDHDDPRDGVPGCVLWQYTDAGDVAGIGHCDDNLFRGNVADLSALAGGAVVLPPTTTGWAEIDRYLTQEGVAVNTPAQDWQTTAGVHTPTSWHYKGMARDYSAGMGTVEADVVAALRPLAGVGGPIIELFHAPTGTWLSHGVYVPDVGGHEDHAHAAIEPGASLPVTALLPEEGLAMLTFRYIAEGLDWVFDGPSALYFHLDDTTQITEVLDPLGVKALGQVSPATHRRYSDLAAAAGFKG